MSFKHLADKIRPHVDFHHAAKVHPDQHHLHATAVGVAAELGMEPNYFNIGHLTQLLSEHVTPPSREFPKHKYHHGEKRDLIVHSAEEEAKLGSEWVDHHWLAGKEHAHDHA